MKVIIRRVNGVAQFFAGYDHRFRPTWDSNKAYVFENDKDVEAILDELKEGKAWRLTLAPA